MYSGIVQHLLPWNSISNLNTRRAALKNYFDGDRALSHRFSITGKLKRMIYFIYNARVEF